MTRNIFSHSLFLLLVAYLPACSSGDKIPEEAMTNGAGTVAGMPVGARPSTVAGSAETTGGMDAQGGTQGGSQVVGGTVPASGGAVTGGGVGNAESAGQSDAGAEMAGISMAQAGQTAVGGRSGLLGGRSSVGGHVTGGERGVSPTGGLESGGASSGGDLVGGAQPMAGMPTGGDGEPGPADRSNTRANAAVLEFGADGVGEVVVDLEDPLSSVWITFSLVRATDLSIELLPAEGEVCSGDPVLLFYRGDDVAPLTQNDDDGDGRQVCSAVDPRENQSMQLVSSGAYFVELSAKQRVVGALKRLVVRKLGQYGDDDDCFVGRQRCAPGRYCCPLDRDCSSRCVQPVCGNRVTEPGEDCDDGNEAAGDGCEGCQSALIEVGQGCPPFSEQVCVPTAFCNPDTELCTAIECGDGIVSPDEACDDGNDDNDDGCDNECRFRGLAPGQPCNPDSDMPQCQNGAYCGVNVGGPVCILTECGNGRLEEEAESCDDGNDVDDDGCNAQCEISPTNAAIEPDSTNAPTALAMQAGQGRLVFFLDDVENAAPADRDYFTFQTLEGDDGTARIHLDNLGVTGCGFLQQFEQPNLENPGSVTFNVYPYVDDGEGGLVPNLEQRLPVVRRFRQDGRDECLSGDINVTASTKYLVETFSTTDRAGGPFWLQVQINPSQLNAGDACDPVDGIQRCTNSYCDAGAVGGPVCAAHRCGDGIVGPSEDCDDQNFDEDDGCSSLCTFGPLGLGRECIPNESICANGAHCNFQATPPTCQAYRQEGESCDRLGRANACEPPNFCEMNEATPGTGLCRAAASASIEDFQEKEPNQLIADIDQPCASLLPQRPCNDIGANMAIQASITDDGGNDPYDLIKFRVERISDVAVKVGDQNGDCQVGLEVYWVPELALMNAALPDANGLAELLTSDNDIESSLGSGGPCPFIFKKAEDVDVGSNWLVVKRASGVGPGEVNYRIQVEIKPRATLGQACDAFFRDPICAPMLACEDLDFNGDGFCVRSM